ncbi:MAG TPA: phosphate regulon sensor histidine kinase PhoR [Quisquiliibacterium sp.]|nr:phosphate regulon sensor histidine kinase PhoR [Quisquiliibacterium sp.]HQN11730.1 phosphate regulon sensor histidine kinase PhoR [Quisquiliibacterium sp.]
MIWLRALAPAAVALAIGALLSWFVSDTVAARWLGGALLLFALMQAFYLTRVHHWAALPRKRDVPVGAGGWGILLDRLARVARQQQESVAELSAELALLHSAVDRLPDGLVVLDRFDHVEWANNAATELHAIFGSRRPIHLFIRQPEFSAYLEGDERARPLVLSLPTRPGRLFELRLHRTDDAHRLLITRDVTEQSKLDAVRRDFVANVSHEIRTPVTVIGGFAETLLNLELDDATRRTYLATILKQSQTMQRLVEDLLTLSSLDGAGGVPVEDTVDLHALIAALADEAGVLSQGAHTITTRIDGPQYVRAAATELESAIRNLLTNAVRYTPAGGRIRIEWRSRDGEGLLSVRDTGIGIPEEHLPRLSERFYRVDRGRSRDTGGTGLGLAIVKHIMNRHGGRLQIESRVGEGSTFTLRLPGRRLMAALPTAANDGGAGAPAERVDGTDSAAA